MKILIDIPEGMLDELNTCKFPIQDAYRLCSIIENGQPLPKGHGDLIDRTALMNRPYETGGFVEWYDEIKYAPSIIEADKEGET